MKTIVLNDEPLLHMALMLVLEKTKPDVVHLKTVDEAIAALDADVGCVVLDLGMPGLDRSRIEAAMQEAAPNASVVLIGPKSDELPPMRHLWTATPHTDAAAIAEFVDES